MRCLALAALVLGLIGTAIASPVDTTVTTDPATVPSTRPTATAPDPPQDDPKPLPRPWCTRKQGLFRHENRIRIPVVPDTTTVGAVCHKLWQELKNRGVGCLVSSPHGCGPSRKSGEAMLEWHFHASVFCKKAWIEDAFKSATNDGEWGKLICREIKV